ncbi:MAG: hypothetical protein M5U30_18795 [Burkholderiaceae bacterium]|nr:hypothetical protein [Burkholderiaceae bacterium]
MPGRGLRHRPGLKACESIRATSLVGPERWRAASSVQMLAVARAGCASLASVAPLGPTALRQADAFTNSETTSSLLVLLDDIASVLRL